MHSSSPFPGDVVAVVIATVATVLCLSLPWSTTEGAEGADGSESRYAPGLCHTSYDLDGVPSTICDAGTIIPGVTGSTSTTSGAPAVSIAFVLAGWVAAGVGAIRRLRPALIVGAGLVAVAVLAPGPAAGSGQISGWVAAGLLLTAGFLLRPARTATLTIF